MSSRSTRPNGHQWIFFKYGGKRHTVRLGKITVKNAEAFRRELDCLLECKQLGLELEPKTRAWVLSLDERPHATLKQAGLLDSRAARTISDLVIAYQDHMKRIGSKPSTLANNRSICKHLVEYFGKAHLIGSIQREDAERFREWLGSGKGPGKNRLAKTTVSRRSRHARSIFAYAFNEQWIQTNPFGWMKNWNEVDSTRNHYFTSEDIEAIINQAPNSEWRLYLALARYGGLRAPSEMAGMLWEWINWEDGTLKINSPKTAHLPNQDSRKIPILEPLRPYLLEASEQALVGQTHLFPNIQSSGAAITKRVYGMCKAAGLEEWPKLWVNMRASCERDWLDKYPIDVVATWMGHSPATALRHYSRVVKDQTTKQASGGALRVEEPISNPKRKAKRRRASEIEKRGPTRS